MVVLLHFGARILSAAAEKSTAFHGAARAGPGFSGRPACAVFLFH
jgi:hypothetical protein